jgi:hypothetical protein
MPKCRFPLVLDTKVLGEATSSHSRALRIGCDKCALAFSYTSVLPQRSSSIAPAPQRCDDKCDICLHLLGAPTCVRVPKNRQCPFQARFVALSVHDNVPHVGRRLNRWNKLERNVGQADERNDGSRDVVVELVSRDDAADEEIDCSILVSCLLLSRHRAPWYPRGSFFPRFLLLRFLVAWVGDRLTYRCHGR